MAEADHCEEGERGVYPLHAEASYEVCKDSMLVLSFEVRMKGRGGLETPLDPPLMYMGKTS